MDCVSLNVSTIRYTVSARAKCIKNQKVGVGWRERGGRGDGFGETNYNTKKVAPGLLREVSRGAGHTPNISIRLPEAQSVQTKEALEGAM